jgi:enterochelin esterase-like enzyme
MLSLRIKIDSYLMFRPTTVLAMLPYGLQSFKHPFPCLWLFHGAGEDAESVAGKGASFIQMAVDRGVAVVIPDCGNFFYQDSSPINRIWTFLNAELLPAIEKYLPVSAAREHNVAAGFSMGGYGAVRLALTKPERFGTVLSLSGALEPMLPVNPREFANPALKGLAHNYRRNLLPSAFPDLATYEGTGADLKQLVRACMEKGMMPRFIIGYGSEDLLVAPQNEAFADFLAGNGIEVDRRIGQCGGHDWIYWNAAFCDIVGELF